jgi:predicted Rossmann-fold nucleotide-binding protein
MSDAFVVMPGGIGTVLEAMMIWQLLQVRHLQNTPLILAGKMYGELVAWCRSTCSGQSFIWPTRRTSRDASRADPS